MSTKDDRLTFLDCVSATWHEPRIMSEYRRLSGSTIGAPDTRSGLDRMIDEACGREPDVNMGESADFLNFVYECVWTRLPPEIRA